MTTGARAREEEQVEQVALLILRREFSPGATHKQLAEEWKCSERTVSRRVEQAVKSIREASGLKLEDWVAVSVAELDSMQAAAMAKQAIVCIGVDRDTKERIMESVPQPDIKAAAYCIELKAKLLGAMAPVKRQEAPAEPLADEDLLEKLTAAKAEVEARLAEKRNSNGAGTNGVH